MDDSLLIQPKVSFQLDLPPSCIQFCKAHPRYFVVGTYNLEKEEPQGEAAHSDKKAQTRNGSLIICTVDEDNVTLVQTLLQPSAVLDLRFHPAPEYQDILAVVSSTASLEIFRLDPKGHPTSPLHHLATSRCEDIGPDVLFLQCNWHPASRSRLAVTTSTGAALMIFLDSELQIESHVELDVANSLEAWCIALSPESPSPESGGRSTSTSMPSTVYCGGDDSILRYSTLTDVDTSFGPIAIKGQHEAGVTAILPTSTVIKGKGRVVLTGSYDEYLRVFAIQDLHDSYGLKRVQPLADLHLGGGVWRLDVIEASTSGSRVMLRILASCMHAGARLVEISTEKGEEWSCKVLARAEEHKSMNYGSDCMPAMEKAEPLRCVSTSFYDRLLCFWLYDET